MSAYPDGQFRITTDGLHFRPEWHGVMVTGWLKKRRAVGWFPFRMGMDGWNYEDAVPWLSAKYETLQEARSFLDHVRAFRHSELNGFATVVG